MRFRRSFAFAAAGALVFTACGGGADVADAPTVSTAPDAGAAPTAPPSSAAGASSPDTTPTTAATDTTPADTAAGASESSVASTGASDDWPDENCVAEPAQAADGPAPDLALRAAADTPTNPLPEVVVRRLNCGGGWVNFKNELPGDKPLLIWFWAPF